MVGWSRSSGQDHRSEGAGTPLRARRLSTPVGLSQMGMDRHWLLDGSAAGEGRSLKWSVGPFSAWESTGDRLINSLWCKRVESYDRRRP